VTQSNTVTVSVAGAPPPPPPPLIVALSDTVSYLQVTFSSVVSGGVRPYTYRLDFGDGISSDTGGNGQETYIYAKAGTYTAKMTVTDASGAQATSSVSVTTVAPPPPPMTAQISATTKTGLTTFVVSVSNGIGGLDIVVDFGDGTHAAAPGGIINHRYAKPGTYTAIANVTDSKGNKASATTSVTVT
jgi:PKD repeat protein